MTKDSAQITVSIVTPIYNGENFLAETLHSILKQTFKDFELLLIDDASTDGSREIAESFALSDPRIKLYHFEKNVGPAVARNLGIKSAVGRYIAFLDSDDLWHPEKLEKQIRFMKEKEIAFSYTAYSTMSEDGVRSGLIRVPERLSYFDLLKTNYIGCLTAMYDTALLGKMEMPLIRKRQDYGLWLSLLRKTPYAHGLGVDLATYRQRRQSVSSKKLSLPTFNWRLYREVEGLNLLESAYYFCHYAVRGFLRHKFPRLARNLDLL